MKRNQLFVILGSAGALFLLVLLALKSVSVDVQKNQQYSQAISAQREKDAILNQTVLKSRYALLSSYDPLVRALADQEELQNNLQQIPIYIEQAGQAEIETVLAQNSEALVEKENLIEQFKSQNSVLKNSLTYLPVLIQELQQDPSLSLQLEELLDQVLLYSLSSDDELIATINAQVTAIENQWQTGQTAASSDVELAIAHTRIILEHKPEVDQLTQNILKVPTLEGINRLETTYDQQHQAAIQTASFYRLLTYGWLLILLAGIAYGVIAQLRKSNKRTVNILESITDSFVALNRQWQITYINPQAAEVLQQDVKALLNQDFWQVFPEHLGSHHAQQYRRVVTEQNIAGFEAYYEPTQTWLEVRAYPGAEGISIFLQDVTERKQAADAMHRLNQELDERVKARTTQLASSI
ncbi:MAG: PAS domain-containing protein, partial [Cyanothece sp. SIO1E1]|nr:PAS domain-containing protein [Cyanothece sp. SIO1E1]